MKYFNTICTANLSCYLDFQILSLFFKKSVLSLFQVIYTLLQHTQGISYCDMMHLGVSFCALWSYPHIFTVCKNATQLLGESIVARKLKMS